MTTTSIADAPAAHPDDIAVDRFAASMKTKLAACRAAGRHGWDDPALCDVENLVAQLIAAVAKGDPVDIANFAMMVHARGATLEEVGSALWEHMLGNDAERAQQAVQHHAQADVTEADHAAAALAAESAQILADAERSVGAEPALAALSREVFSMANRLQQPVDLAVQLLVLAELRGLRRLHGDGLATLTMQT